MNDHIKTLTERRDYLSLRIAAKAQLGWDHAYDERERDALSWVIDDVWQWMLTTKEELELARAR